MSTFENILENLKKKYQQEYGVAVFDIEAKSTKLGIIIKGKVLTENQKDEILEEFKKNKIKIKKENIKVLSGADKRNEIGWAIVKNKIIDLRLRFVSGKILNEKILNRIRCSQAFTGEVLRVLYEYEDQLLVQQNDLTLGWVDGKDVVFRKKTSSLDKGRLGGVKNRGRLDLYRKWKNGNYALKNKVLNLKSILKCHPEFISGFISDFKKNNTMHIDQNISEIKTRQSVNQKKIPELNSGQALKQVQDDNVYDDNMQNKIIKEAEKYLGVKYVLGGKSKHGIDCSGLIQVAYKNSLGIILPKHSWDQKEMGIKIDLKNIKTGDLIFLIKKENGHKHVGIAEVINLSAKPKANKRLFAFGLATAKRDINLIHASLNKKKVVRQRLEKVFESHEFVEARRIISL